MFCLLPSEYLKFVRSIYSDSERLLWLVALTFLDQFLQVFSPLQLVVVLIINQFVIDPIDPLFIPFN